MKRNSHDDSNRRTFEGGSVLRPIFNTKGRESEPSSDIPSDLRYNHSPLHPQGEIEVQPSPIEEPHAAAKVGYTENANNASEHSVASPTHPRQLENPDGLRQSSSLDRNTEQSGRNSLEEKSEGLPETRRGFDWSGSWVWEICGAILSIVCIALMIGLLVNIEGMSYAHWQYSISPNTVLAIISAFTKASMLVPVSACLGQLKWTKDDQKFLYHFQVLDQASRGPWGALWVFWNIKSGYAITAAALTIISIALDPFAQQILHFPSQERIMHNETAYVPRIHSFAPDESSTIIGSSPIMDPIMQTAMLTGLAGVSDPLRPTCSTPRCEFPDFSTLGMCGSCQDVTNQTVQTCQPLSLSKFNWKDILVGEEEEYKNFSSVPANCTYLTPGGFQATPEIVDLDRPYNTDYAVIQFQPLTSVISDTYRRDTFFAFSTFKYVEHLVYSPKNISAIGRKSQINECSLYACEKIYTNNFYSSSGPSLQPSEIVPLVKQLPSEVDAYGLLPSDTYNLVPKHGKPTFHNSSYSISGGASGNLVMMAGLFETSYIHIGFIYSASQGKFGIQLAPILFNSANLSGSVEKRAASMTDSMRSRVNATHVSGDAYRTESFISVRWPWIILPAALVVCSTLIFAAMVKTTQKHSVLWKSSVLPLMIGRLKTSPGNDLSYERHLDSIQTISQKIRLVVEDDKDQGLLKFSER